MYVRKYIYIKQKRKSRERKIILINIKNTFKTGKPNYSVCSRVCLCVKKKGGVGEVTQPFQLQQNMNLAYRHLKDAQNFVRAKNPYFTSNMSNYYQDRLFRLQTGRWVNICPNDLWFDLRISGLSFVLTLRAHSLQSVRYTMMVFVFITSCVCIQSVDIQWETSIFVQFLTKALSLKADFDQNLLFSTLQSVKNELLG